MVNRRLPVVDYCVEGFAEFKESIGRAASALIKIFRFVATLNEATSKEMHYIKYSKKKRIRKKYYNRALKRALQKVRED